MNQFDLALYGHLTVDYIINNFKETTSLGAIANVWHALSKIDPNIKLKINPSAIGEAIVVINEMTTQRVGRGNLNMRTINPKIIDSQWHHIMYLNRLEDISFLSEIKSGIVSADTTAGDLDIFDSLPHIDYLFVSDEDLFFDINELAKQIKGWVILHYPGGSYSTDGSRSITKTNEIRHNVNVLGAGDTFAACFISSMLKNNDMDSSLDYAHQNTIRILTDEI